jgi:hypothetical protein
MNGYEKNIKDWEERFTVKQFLDNNNVSKEDLNHLINLFEYIPIQQGIMNHFWLLLGPNDQDFKTFMYENICHTADKREHMYAISSAPYVFLSVIHEANCKKDKSLSNFDAADKGQKLTNIGLHAGVILAEAIRMGYDVSQVGCMEGKKGKTMSRRFSELVRKSLSETDKENYFQNPDDANTTKYTPILAICIGEGLPLSEQFKTMVAGRPAVIGQKAKKLTKNITVRTPSE